MPKPGEAPQSWKMGSLCYGTGLNLEIAQKMMASGEKEALNQNVPMAMAISDSGGNLLAFLRMDNTMLSSTQIALDKAYTAVFGKLPTADYSTNLQIRRAGAALFPRTLDYFCRRLSHYQERHYYGRIGR